MYFGDSNSHIPTNWQVYFHGNTNPSVKQHDTWTLKLDTPVLSASINLSLTVFQQYYICNSYSGFLAQTLHEHLYIQGIQYGTHRGNLG